MGVFHWVLLCIHLNNGKKSIIKYVIKIGMIISLIKEQIKNHIPQKQLYENTTSI